jgi:hypothetical protein
MMAYENGNLPTEHNIIEEIRQNAELRCQYCLAELERIDEHAAKLEEQRRMFNDEITILRRVIDATANLDGHDEPLRPAQAITGAQVNDLKRILQEKQYATTKITGNVNPTWGG